MNMKNNPWHRCSECPPPNSKLVLGYYSFGDFTIGEFRHVGDPKNEGFYIGGCPSSVVPVYWTHLPKPPIAKDIFR